MRIGWAKMGNGEVVEEEVLNGTLEVPYPYVNAEEVAARPQLRRETLEATEANGEAGGQDDHEWEYVGIHERELGRKRG